MRLAHSLSLLAVIFLINAQAFEWNNEWTATKDSMLSRRSAEAEAETEAPKQQDAEGRNYAVHEPIYSNDTNTASNYNTNSQANIDTVIDQIINSRREGRNLGEELDQVYADGNIDQALQDGNDLQARNLIRDKLCGLGLMSCDVEEKRPYYSTIYAQGPPPPPNHFGGGPYGPAKPMPPPGHFSSRPGPPPPPPSSLNSFGPPRKVGFEGSYKPNYRPSGPGPTYNGPYLENPPPSAVDGSDGVTFSRPPPGAIIYNSMPPGPVFTGNADKPPYHFENSVGEGIQTAGSQHNNFYSHQLSGSTSSAASASKVVIGGPAAVLANPAAAGLQQHVHHHFHHVEGTEGVGAQVPSVPIPIGAGQTINTDFSALAQSSTAFTPQTQGGFTGSAAFTAGFNGASQGGLLGQGLTTVNKPNGEIYKPTGGLGSYTGASGSYQPTGTSAGYGQSGFGSVSGSYHSQNPDYYKKDLHNTGGIVASSSLNGLGPNAGFGGQPQYQGGFDTARQQIVDCQCVPISQCPAADRIGRKEDLILPIDPRNLGKDIEALSDESAANITVSTNADPTGNKETVAADDIKRSRRQATAEDKQTVDDGDLQLDAQGLPGLGNIQALLPALQAIALTQRKILPTYGVSFGLPNPNSNGYPVNAHGDFYPAKNPNFGSIGPDGLNLGLVNVNPLVSVQVSKTYYGEKVVKPFVNLHVTPNANILQKVGNIFKRKPNQEYATHYHHHDHYSGYVSEHEYEHEHYHDHQPQIVSDVSPIEHYPTTGPYSIVEMVPSKPIFEYHSSYAVPLASQPPPPFQIPAPVHHHEVYPYDSSISNSIPQASFGQTAFAEQHALGSQYYPSLIGAGQVSQVYPSTGTAGFGPADFGGAYDRSANISTQALPGYPTSSSKYQEFPIEQTRRGKQLSYAGLYQVPTQAPGAAEGSSYITFPRDRKRRSVEEHERTAVERESVLGRSVKLAERAYYGNRPVQQSCRSNEVCCRRPYRPAPQQLGRCGVRNAAGITGRIKNPVYVDGDSEFGEYPWHVAILKKDPKESIYACGGTLIDAQHVLTAAHCIKSQNGFDLRARLGEWDVNHDVEFFPYIERDVVSVHIHPEYYAGTLDNDLAMLKLDQPVDFTKNPHISPACLPDKFSVYTGARCWTTGWGKDAFGDQGKYQNILKEVDVPILSHQQCETQLRQTRLGYGYKLNAGFLCAGGEEGKDACKGDGGGPLVCERNGVWNVVGVVSWGIGCGQVNVPGIYVRVAHYLDWINQITQYYK